MEEKINTFALTKQDTAVLKGIAIVAMLMHHLWGCAPSGVEPYTGVLGMLGVLGKVCVAIFLFCSGYGLSVGYSNMVNNAEGTMHNRQSKVLNTFKFLAKRFIKFYANYWFVFIIFVPISIFVFGRPLSAAYGEHVNILKRLLVDIIGVQGYQSYNITWWFNRLILTYYLLFPLVYHVGKYSKWLMIMLALGFTIYYWNKVSAHIEFCPELMVYAFPFSLGIFWYMCQDINVNIQTRILKHRYVYILFSSILLILMVFVRSSQLVPGMSGIQLDGFLVLTLVLWIVGLKSLPKYILRCFSFVGKHSMNTYMTHTFFFSYWFSTFFYSRELGGGYEYDCSSHSLYCRKCYN